MILAMVVKGDTSPTTSVTHQPDIQQPLDDFPILSQDLQTSHRYEIFNIE